VSDSAAVPHAARRFSACFRRPASETCTKKTGVDEHSLSARPRRHTNQQASR